MVRTERVLAEGFSYLEGPRWHDGRLWASDFYTNRILSFDPSGEWREEAVVPGQPSGLGWLSDGTLLAVSMRDRAIVRIDRGVQTVYADLSSLATWHLNDMLVDSRDYVYVGNFGFDLMNGANPRMANIVCIAPDGGMRVVAEEMFFPNGMAVTPDGRSLIVAESFAQRLTAFDLADGGALENRRVWSKFGEVPQSSDLEGMLAEVSCAPDGIAIDKDGDVWFADGFSQRVVRTREGAGIVEIIETEESVFACALGGAEGRTLFVCSAPSFAEAEASAVHRARLIAYEVDVPGLG